MGRLTGDAVAELAQAEGIAAADIPGEVLVMFVTHSIPIPMAHASGPPTEPNVYVTSQLAACEAVVGELAQRFGAAPAWGAHVLLPLGLAEGPVARAGRQRRPRGGRAARGARRGRRADRLRLRSHGGPYDLDEEAARTAAEHGLAFTRVSTVRDDAEFVAGLLDLVADRAAARAGVSPRVARGTHAPLPRRLLRQHPRRPSPDDRAGARDRCPLRIGPRRRGRRSSSRTLDESELRDLELLAREVAIAAGALIRDERPERLTIDTKSSSSDVVTQMDGRAEAFIRERLAQARPHDAVFGGGLCGAAPEGAAAQRTWITWVVDPIDGTVNYLYGIGEYAVSVAAVVGDPTRTGQWRPVAGAVAHPAAGLVYSAARGQGARVHRVDPTAGATDATPLIPSGAEGLELALVGTGFAYVAQATRQARELVEILSTVRDIRRGGSAALDLCAVAAGRLDGDHERGINAWDCWVARRHRGRGIVSGVGGEAPTPAGVVAATPGVQPALRALVERVTLGGTEAGELRR